jgi:hypothetical protein
VDSGRCEQQDEEDGVTADASNKRIEMTICICNPCDLLGFPPIKKAGLDRILHPRPVSRVNLVLSRFVDPCLILLNLDLVRGLYGSK